MIRNIFSSMWHSKLRVLLILFLATITFFLALLTLTNSFAFNTQISMVEDMFSSLLNNTYRIDVSYIEDFETSGIAISELKEYINQQENAVCGAYDQSGEYFDELQYNHEYILLNQKSYAGTFRENTPTISEVVFFDTQILSFMSVNLSEKDFLPIDQNGKYICHYMLEKILRMYYLLVIHLHYLGMEQNILYKDFCPI